MLGRQQQHRLQKAGKRISLGTPAIAVTSVTAGMPETVGLQEQRHQLQQGCEGQKDTSSSWEASNRNHSITQNFTLILSKAIKVKETLFGMDQTEQGYLTNPQQAQHSYRREPVAILASRTFNAGMKQFKCGCTQPLSCNSRDHGETSGQNLKG